MATRTKKDEEPEAPAPVDPNAGPDPDADSGIPPEGSGTTAPVEPPPEPPAEPQKTRSKSAPEFRRTVNTWWCPNDDTSVPAGTVSCPKDGFVFMPNAVE